MDDIEEAATKVKLGPAKKRLQSEEDKKINGYVRELNQNLDRPAG